MPDSGFIALLPPRRSSGYRRRADPPDRTANVHKWGDARCCDSVLCTCRVALDVGRDLTLRLVDALLGRRACTAMQGSLGIRPPQFRMARGRSGSCRPHGPAAVT